MNNVSGLLIFCLLILSKNADCRDSPVYQETPTHVWGDKMPSRGVLSSKAHLKGWTHDPDSTTYLNFIVRGVYSSEDFITSILCSSSNSSLTFQNGYRIVTMSTQTLVCSLTPKEISNINNEFNNCIINDHQITSNDHFLMFHGTKTVRIYTYVSDVCDVIYPHDTYSRDLLFYYFRTYLCLGRAYLPVTLWLCITLAIARNVRCFTDETYDFSVKKGLHSTCFQAADVVTPESPIVNMLVSNRTVVNMLAMYQGARYFYYRVSPVVIQGYTIYQNKVSPCFIARSKSQLRRFLLEWLTSECKPNCRTQFHSPPVILSELSGGFIPESVALHVAETFALYALQLWRAPSNADRALIFALMYKHLRSDKDLPFRSYTEEKWKELVALFTAYVTAQVTSSSPDEDKMKHSFIKSDLLDMESSLFKPTIAAPECKASKTFEDADCGRYSEGHHTVFQALGDDHPPVFNNPSSKNVVVSAVSGLKGLVQSKLVHTTIFLTTSIALLLSGVPITNLAPYMERLPLHMQTIQTLTVVEQLTSALTWVKDTGVKLVTGQYKTWSDVFPTLDITQWAEVATVRIRNDAAIVRALATDNQDLELEGMRVGNIHEQVRLLHDIWNQGQSHLRRIKMTQYTAGKKLLEEKITQIRGIYDALILDLKSQATRKSPLGILLFGASSIGKTSLTAFLQHWHAEVLGLPSGDEYVYTLNPTAEFWDGFRSYKHTLVLDDIGSVKASVGEDQGIINIIRTINNVPFVPNMASLEDKGAHPFLGRLVIATSNDKGFCAGHRTNNPEALQRRLKFVITPTLRDDYIEDGSFKLPRGIDKIDENVSPWNFKVESANIVLGSPGYVINYKNLATEDRTFQGDGALNDLRAWLTEVTLEHDRNQENFLKSKRALLECKYCRVHNKWNCDCRPPCAEIHPLAESRSNHSLFSNIIMRFRSFFATGASTIEAKCASLGIDVPSENTTIDGVCKDIAVENYTFGRYIQGLFVPNPITLSQSTLVKLKQGTSKQVNFQAVDVTGGTNFSTLMTHVVVPVCVSTIFYVWVWPKLKPIIAQCYATISLLVYYYYTCQSWMFWYNTTSARAYRLMDALSARLPSSKVLVCIAVITGALTIVVMSQSWANAKTTFHMEDAPNGRGFTPPKNVWSGSGVVSSISAASKTLCGKSFGDKLHALKKNIVNVVVTCKGHTSKRAVGLISGQYLLFNRHALADYSATHIHVDVRFPIVDGRMMAAYSSKEDLVLNQSWTYNEERDLVLVNMVDSRASDVFKYFLDNNNHTALPHNIFALVERNEIVHQIPLEPVSFQDTDIPYRISHLHTKYGVGTTRICQYRSDTNALNGGDSGSMIVGQFQNGLAIIGIHTGGSNGAPYDGHCMTLSSSIVHEMIKKVTPVIFHAMGIPQLVVDAGEHILLQADGSPETYSGSMSRFCPLAKFDDSPSIEAKNMVFVGSLLHSFRSQNSSQVQKTPYYKNFEHLAQKYDCVNFKVAPIFNWLSKRHFLETVSKITNHSIITELNSFVDALYHHFQTNCPSSESTLLKPLTLQQAINGEEKCVYLDRMNMATSAGRPYNACKKEVLVPTSDGMWTLTPYMRSAHNTYLRMLKNGVRTNLPFKASLKDEPIDPKKLSMVEPRGKGPRLFMASNVDLTILIRMFYLPYARIAQRNPFLFMSAPGMNCASSVWFALRNYLCEHGCDKIMAGDYSGFDVRMMSLMTYYSLIFMQAVLFSGGHYSPDDKCATHTLMYDIINPNCEIDGDHFQIYGTNPSGHPLTVHVNCLSNIFYIMFTYVRNGGFLGQFFHDIKVITYGDDNVLGIRDPSVVNYMTMRDTLATIGVIYTRADKTNIVDGKLDHIDDVEFLKRKFVIRRIRDRDYCLCPLDRKSLFKTLDMWMKSKTVVEKEQARDSLSAVWQGTLFHDGMDDVRAEISNVVCGYLGYLPDNLFPTFDTFIDNYDKASEDVEKFFHFPNGGAMFTGSLYVIWRRTFTRYIVHYMPRDMVYLPQPGRREVGYWLTWWCRFCCLYLGQTFLGHLLRFLCGNYWAAIAAYIEEILYYLIGPLGRLIFAIMEFIDYVSVGVPWQARIPALLMHCVCAFMPFWLGTTIHCAFNHLCMVLPQEVMRLLLNPRALWQVLCH